MRRLDDALVETPKGICEAEIIYRQMALATVRPSRSLRSNRSIGSATRECSARSATSHPTRPKNATPSRTVLPLWGHNPQINRLRENRGGTPSGASRVSHMALNAAQLHAVGALKCS